MRRWRQAWAEFTRRRRAAFRARVEDELRRVRLEIETARQDLDREHADEDDWWRAIR